jgi:hypothetical protein
VTGKEKKIRLIDIRNGSKRSCMVAESAAHTGNKMSKICWLGETPCFLTVGHNAMQERETMLWDSRNLAKPIKRERLDVSTSSLSPLIDPDTGLVALVGKGDSSIRLYEAAPTGDTLFPITNFPLGIEIIRGCAILPKQACDGMSCEIMKLLISTATSIQPVSFRVPRREKLKFHADLYPPTVWGAPSVLEPDIWLRGETAISTKIPVVFNTNASKDDTHTSSSSASNMIEADAVTSGTSDIEIQPSRRVSTKIDRRSCNYGSNLKFRHLYGKENPKSLTSYGLRPNTISDNALIACSNIYWAVPYQGSGGGPVVGVYESCSMNHQR